MAASRLANSKRHLEAWMQRNPCSQLQLSRFAGAALCMVQLSMGLRHEKVENCGLSMPLSCILQTLHLSCRLGSAARYLRRIFRIGVLILCSGPVVATQCSLATPVSAASPYHAVSADRVAECLTAPEVGPVGLEEVLFAGLMPWYSFAGGNRLLYSRTRRLTAPSSCIDMQTCRILNG